MDIEIGLLSRMISTGGVDAAIAGGIEPRHFSDPACREIYQTCVEHVRTWRISPSVDVVRRRHPDFKVMPVTDDLGYLIKEFTTECARKAAIEKWRDIGNTIDKADQGDNDAREHLITLFMEHARELAVLIPTPRSSRMSDMMNRVLTIKKQQETGALPGVRIGIQQLDPYVHVVRSTELVVHCGYSSRGKTTGLVRSAVQAYEEGENGVFFSLEMDGDEIWEIFDARVAQLTRTAIRRRELGGDDYERYEKAAERVKAAQNDIIVIDDTDGSPTIDKLAAYVERYRPQFVCVDYISLMASHMKTASDWERVSLISRGLKQLARATKTKVYAAAQNNRSAADNGPTEDNIAFSSSIYQDCNIMVGYHQDPEMEKKKQVQVRLIKQRGGSKGPIGDSGYGEFLEYWDRDRMIFEDWTARHGWDFKMRQDANGSS